VNAYIPK